MKSSSRTCFIVQLWSSSNVRHLHPEPPGPLLCHHQSSVFLPPFQFRADEVWPIRVNVHVKSVPIVEHSGWLSRQSVFACVFDWFRRSRVRKGDDKCVVWFYFGVPYFIFWCQQTDREQRKWIDLLSVRGVDFRVLWNDWCTIRCVVEQVGNKILVHRYILSQLYYMCGNPMYYVEVRSGPKTKTKTNRGKWGRCPSSGGRCPEYR